MIRRERCTVSKGRSGQRWRACCPTYLRNLEAVAGPVTNGDESPFFLAAAAAAASSPPEAYDRRSESHCTVTSSAQHTLRHTNVSTAHSGHSGLKRPSLCRYSRAMYVSISLARANGGRRERESTERCRQRAYRTVVSCTNMYENIRSILLLIKIKKAPYNFGHLGIIHKKNLGFRKKQ